MLKPPAPSGGRTLTERTVAGLGWTSLAMGAQAVLQLVALIVLARLLQPEQFGLFAAAMVVAGFSTIFSELGVGPAIVQRPVLEPRHIRVGFTLSVLLSLAAGACVWLAAPAIAGFFDMPDLVPMLGLMAVAFPLQGLSRVALSLVLRDLGFRWLALIDAGAFAIGFVVVAPLLILSDVGVLALVGGYLTQHGLRALALLRGRPHEKRPLLEIRAIRELLFFGGGFTLARIGNFLAGQGDNLVVGRWIGPAGLGIYSHAYQLMAAPAKLLGEILDRVLFSTMASVQREPERLLRAYRSGVFTCALLILPGSLVIAIVADEIVLVLLGSNWADVAGPLSILACGMLFRTSYKMSDTIAKATGAVYARAWRQAIFALAVFTGAAIGQFWGLCGVAFGVFLALAVNFGLMAQLSLRLTGMRWKDFGRAHLPGMILAALAVASSLAVVTWLRDLETPDILILAVASLLVCTLTPLLIWLKPDFFLGPDARQMMRALTRLAPARLRGWFPRLRRWVHGEG